MYDFEHEIRIRMLPMLILSLRWAEGRPTWPSYVPEWLPSGSRQDEMRCSFLGGALVQPCPLYSWGGLHCIMRAVRLPLKLWVPQWLVLMTAQRPWENSKWGTEHKKIGWKGQPLPLFISGKLSGHFCEVFAICIWKLRQTSRSWQSFP